jgi:sulfatase maturation enzyme AslB (radical SAM superfamily)
MRLWRTINVEISSMCNRACPTCLRTSTPDRESVDSWFRPNYMPMEVIKAILDEHVVLDHRCRFSPNVYNEPLLDPRLIEILQMVRSYRLPNGEPRFLTALVTNGELLTPELARDLDPLLDNAAISLYIRGRARRRRRRKCRELLPTTRSGFKGSHVLTHYGPDKTLPRVPCTLGRRMLINHKGQFLLCCEDMLGLFAFGSFPEMSLAQFWESSQRNEIVQDVCVNKDRSKYLYCQDCPMV